MLWLITSCCALALNYRVNYYTVARLYAVTIKVAFDDPANCLRCRSVTLEGFTRRTHFARPVIRKKKTFQHPAQAQNGIEHSCEPDVRIRVNQLISCFSVYKIVFSNSHLICMI